MSEPDADPDAAVPMPEPSDGEEGHVHVVGTAHVSEKSVEEVDREIRERRPDVVAVELDEGRFRQMQGETPDDIEATDLLRGNTVFQFLAYWMLSYVQAQLGDRFDIEPGADMQAAIDTAEDLGIGVALVDRDIQVTIQRFWTRMTAIEKVQMIAGLAFGVAQPPMVALTAGLMVGVFLGPILGIAAGIAGVSSAVMTSLVGGGLVGLVVGYVLFEVGVRTLGEDRGIALGIAGAVLGVAAGAATGVANPVVSTFVVGGLQYLLGGLVAGVAVGVTLGTIAALYLAVTTDPEEYEEDFDIDDMTDADVVTAMLEEFRKFSPGGAEALIDERDAYIAHKLVALRDQGYDVVAVVGAGHRQGIEEYLRHPETLPDFQSLVGEESGRRFSLFKAVGYLMAIGFITFFVLLILGGAENEFLLTVFGTWFLFNGVFAFGLAKLAGARWVSAGVGGAIAWLTSINPLLAPGWFAGYVELKYTSVNVSDIATLNDIIADEERPVGQVMSDMFDVPLFKLIMVVALTNVGSMIASYLYPFVVLPAIAPEGDVGEIADLMIQGAQNGLDIVLSLF